MLAASVYRGKYMMPYRRPQDSSLRTTATILVQDPRKQKNGRKTKLDLIHYAAQLRSDLQEGQRWSQTPHGKVKKNPNKQPIGICLNSKVPCGFMYR